MNPIRLRPKSPRQQLLDGASARDDVGDALSFGMKLDLHFGEAESMGVCSPFRPFQLLQVAPRFLKNRLSNRFCNFSRIK
jgi:hypothetical protein